MTDMNNEPQDHETNEQPNEADSRADAIAALCLILIAAAAAIYFVSNQ